MRSVRLLVLGSLLAACTFPDVDYADDAGAAGGTCAAPAACADDAASCGDTARKKHHACDEKCKPNESDCWAECAAELGDALVACAAECESCAAPACGGAATNCAALTGE